MTIPDAPISAVMPATAADVSAAGPDSMATMPGASATTAPEVFALLLPGAATAPGLNGPQGQASLPGMGKDKNAAPLTVGAQGILASVAPILTCSTAKTTALASDSDTEEPIGDNGANGQPAKDDSEDLQPSQQIAVAAMLYMIPPTVAMVAAPPQIPAGGQPANGQTGAPAVTLPTAVTSQPNAADTANAAATDSQSPLANVVLPPAASTAPDAFANALAANSPQGGAPLPLPTTVNPAPTPQPVPMAQESTPAPAVVTFAPVVATSSATVATPAVIPAATVIDQPGDKTVTEVASSVDAATSEPTVESTPADPTTPAADTSVSTPAANSAETDAFPAPETGDAKIAVPVSTVVDLTKNEAAKTTAHATEFVAPTVVRAAYKMTGNADGSLVSGQVEGGKKARGTAGAKAGGNMENRPSTTNSLHAQQSGSVAGNSSVRPVTASTSREQEDGFANANREPLNRTTSTTNSHETDTPTFSIPTTNLHTSIDRSDTTAPVTASKDSNAVSASAVLDEVNHNLARIQPHGNSRVDLQVALEDGGHVSIQLQFRDGAVHASFQTSSPEMREALQQGWSQMAARSDSSIPLGDAVFKSPSSMLGSNSGQQQFREQRQSQSQFQEPSMMDSSATPFNQPKRGSRAPGLSQSTTSGLSLWA